MQISQEIASSIWQTEMERTINTSYRRKRNLNVSEEVKGEKRGKLKKPAFGGQKGSYDTISRRLMLTPNFDGC